MSSEFNPETLSQVFKDAGLTGMSALVDVILKHHGAEFAEIGSSSIENRNMRDGLFEIQSQMEKEFSITTRFFVMGRPEVRSTQNSDMVIFSKVTALEWMYLASTLTVSINAKKQLDRFCGVLANSYDRVKASEATE